MARRKKPSPGGGVFGVIGIGLIALIAAIPREAWILFGIACAVGLVFDFYVQHKKNRPSVSADADFQNPRRELEGSALKARDIRTPVKRHVDGDEPIRVISPAASRDFSLPPEPKSTVPAAWIKPGQSTSIAGMNVPDGMIYVGTFLPTPNGGNDPCLIVPSKPVASIGDYTERQMGYWPSYSEISASARRAYLNWLAGGRRDPEADIGYVFLFFYGLERRAIIDSERDLTVHAEWPAIASELRRLLGIYGEQSGSFRRYASELLNWLSVAEQKEQLYKQPIPVFPRTFELPLYLRLALGQAAVDAAPLPPDLALAWLKLDPNTFLRTPATRCEELFHKQYQLRYVEAFGSGMVVPRNRTKLKLVYIPASSGLRGYNEIKLTFGDLPDVSVLTAPIKKLLQVAEVATKDLDAYSRFLGRNPDAKHSLEGLLLLPVSLWPDSAKMEIQTICEQVLNAPVVIGLQELLSRMDARGALSKDRVLALARALESSRVGVEPDVLGGAKLPKGEDNIVLFTLPVGEQSSRTHPAYQVAVLTLQLASAVAAADGAFSQGEVEFLQTQIEAWTHLTPHHIHRLKAHLQLLIGAPVSLTSLKKKLEPLDTPAKEAIACFMAAVAQSDGHVAPAEVKLLEKIYKALGIDSNKVFSDVHAAAAGGMQASPAEADVAIGGFKLNAERIALLQRDTEKVSALLADIFKEDERPEVQDADIYDSDAETDSVVAARGVMGLDEAHSAFVRMLLSRPEWTRSDLLDVAADLDLMLDGALERINEASFDSHDAPLTEGEDPIEVNREFLEKIEA